MGSCARKSLIMRWAKAYKESQEILLKWNVASHNTTSWCTDTDGSLEHSLSGGNLYDKGPGLQKIIPGFFGPPPLLHF